MDPLEVARRSMIERGLIPPDKNRAQRRAHHDGLGAGEGKHPIGATKPFRRDRKAKARRRARARR